MSQRFVCKVFFAAMLLLGPAVVAPPASAQPTAETPVSIPRSQQIELISAEGRPFQIFIATPKDSPPATGYAVMYVLDANAMFATAVEAVRFQKGLVPTVVVGIGFPGDKPLNVDRRYKEYTPVTSPEKLQSPNEPPVKPGGTGGQDEFLAFIETVLKPEVARRFSIDPKRQAIFGHSLGGRFVLHVMFTKPEAFQVYLAASPSIWWDDRSVLKEEAAFRERLSISTSDVRLLLTCAEFEQRLTDATPKERAEFLTKARMVDNAKEMFERLSAAKVKATFKEFEDENHGTVVPGAISRAVKFAFTEKP